MTEQAPSGLSALDKERAKLEKQRAKLDHQEDVLRREEAFGKYDDNVTPAEGEVTYEQYLEQRPAEPGKITRTGNNFYNHEAKKSATLNDYYMDTVVKNRTEAINRVEGPYEVPKYDEMSLAELAQSVTSARELGDRAAVEQAREEARERFTMEIVNEGNDDESSEAAQERFDKMMAHFDAVAESAVLYNGEKVVVGDVFENATGKRAVEVIDADGNTHLVREAELTYKAPIELPATKVEESKAKAPASVEPAPVDGVVHLETTTDDDGEPVTRVSVLPPKLASEETPSAADADKGKGGSVEKEKVETTTAETLSRKERLKEWFKNGGKKLRSELGIAYWTTHFKVADTYEKHVLNRGVTQEMDAEQVKKKRERNRHVFLAGSAGIAVLAITGIGLAAGLSVDMDSSQDVATKTLSVPEAKVSLPVTEVIPETPPAPEAIPAEVFNIPAGGGGEELFEAAGINPTVWYNNEDALLSDFSDELYRMADGHVGIARPGMLSQDLRDRIQSLK